MENINQPEVPEQIPETPTASAVQTVPEAPVIPAAPTVIYTKPLKKEWPVKKHDAAFAWLMMLFGFLFMRYVLVYADGFVTTAFFLLLFGASEIYIRKSGCRPKLPHHILGLIICAFSTVFSLTASALLHGLCFVFITAMLIWRTHSVCSGAGFVTRFLPFDLCSRIFRAPAQHAGAGPQAVSESVKRSGTATAVKTILVGLLVTVPLTVVVAVLLGSADSGVEEILVMIGDSLTENMMVTCIEIACAIPVGIWLFGMLYSAAQKIPVPDDLYYEQKLEGARMIPNLGLYAGVTPIYILYLLYVISQTSYFLSAFAGKLPSDMIYSEYARRGFFELCAIAVINLAVILVLTGCAKNGGKNRPKVLTGYAAVLCLFTLFIIATALAKMVLYIEAYGLTRLRLYTAWFMVLLAVIFLVLLVRQFVRRIPTAAVLTVSFTVLFAVLCFSRPDALISEYNISRYEQGTLSDLDVETLCQLSDDAYPVMAAHSSALLKADSLDVFRRRTEGRTSAYEEHPDRKWNLSAQLLLHTPAVQAS